MQKWREIALTAALGATVPLVGGFVWLGRLDNRVEQLERRQQASDVALDKMAVPHPDPIRSQCAQLASTAATGDDTDWEASGRVKAAMDALGCIRAN